MAASNGENGPTSEASVEPPTHLPSSVEGFRHRACAHVNVVYRNNLDPRVEISWQASLRMEASSSPRIAHMMKCLVLTCSKIQGDILSDSGGLLFEFKSEAWRASLIDDRSVQDSKQYSPTSTKLTMTTSNNSLRNLQHVYRCAKETIQHK